MRSRSDPGVAVVVVEHPMSEILSHQEATKAWVLLQQGGVTIDGGMEALDALWFSHEALRARLAEVEAERDNLAMFHRDWYANDLPEMQRLAMWLHPDPNLPLPNLRNLANASIARAEAAEARLAEVERLLLRQTNLNTEAITQRMAAEARLAEVEQALRDARLFTSKDYIAVGRAGLVVQMGAADDILAAVLDKEEHG